MRGTWWDRAAQLLVLASVYFLVGRLGLTMASVGLYATLVWPPTGLALAVLLLRGFWLWPGVALGALTVNLAVGAPVPAALGMTLGNTLEAVVGALLLRQVGFHPALDRSRDVFALIALGAVLSTLISACLGIGSLWAAGMIRTDQVIQSWRAWWLGNVVADVTVAPVLLVWATNHHVNRRLGRWLEAAALGVLLALCGLLFFGAVSPVPAGYPYLLFPLLIWAAVRFGPRGATTAVLLASSTAIWATVTQHGRGPFGAPTVALSLMALQAFMAIMAIAALVLAATIAERDRAVRRVHKLLAIVSHDLKNPLSAIQLSSALLEQRLPSAMDHLACRQLSVIQRSSQRMTVLVRDLLDLAAIEEGKLSMVLGAIDVRVLIEEASDLARPLATARGQSLEVTAGHQPLVARCDRERVLQVLSNLLGNATTYAPEGSTIRVQVQRVEDSARVAVWNSGPGIDPTLLPHLFEPFWKAMRGEHGSVGLGLSIAQGIVVAHGGTIWAESERDRGTTFYFTLPLVGGEVEGRAGVPWLRVRATR